MRVLEGDFQLVIPSLLQRVQKVIWEAACRNKTRAATRPRSYQARAAEVGRRASLPRERLGPGACREQGARPSLPTLP